MTTVQRVSTLMLVAIMLICSVNTTAFAAETNAISDSSTVMEFEITPEMMSKNGEVAVATNVLADHIFNVTGIHTGGTRTYYGNAIQYHITITDTNGNPASNILSVQLYNSSHTQIREQQFWADGKTNVCRYDISYGSAYYFKYALAYGDMRTLMVHMIITIE